jgi:hypothetical protein
MLPVEVRSIDRLAIITDNRVALNIKVGFLAIVLKRNSYLLTTFRTLPKTFLLLHQVVEQEGGVEVYVYGLATVSHEIIIGNGFQFLKRECHSLPPQTVAN